MEYGKAQPPLVMLNNYTNSDLVALFSLALSSLIAIIGIVVNAIIAVWVIHAIQSKINNERVLKDHLIGEIKEIRNEYKSCLNSLYSNKISAKRVIPWFKLMNIKVSDLSEIIYTKYKIDRDILKPYQIDLADLITNNEDFVNQFDNDDPIEFSASSKNTFVRFQQNHNHLFNSLIIGINDAN